MARANPALLRISDPLRGCLSAGDCLLLPDVGHRHRALPAAHLAPLFFAISYLLSRTPIEHSSWQVAGMRIGVRQFQLLVLTVLTVDVAFHLWPRLMTTYGGF
jgi:hypothetical protein